MEKEKNIELNYVTPSIKVYTVVMHNVVATSTTTSTEQLQEEEFTW